MSADPTTPAELVEVPVSPLAPERFRDVLTEEQWQTFDHAVGAGRALLSGRVVWNVNSTARGGGVAEMLSSLIAYARGAGVDARWVVIEGDDEFFRVTKRIHNRLHGARGDGGTLGADERLAYDRTTRRNLLALSEHIRPGDLVLLHDPQTVGLAPGLREQGARVIWRCHVGLDFPNDDARAAWSFLLPDVRSAEAQVFSRSAFIWEGLDKALVVVIPPSIDAFSPKNQDLEGLTVRAILRRAGIEAGGDPGAPVFRHEDGTPGRVDRAAEVIGGPFPAEASVVTQVSRWDRLKDPIGVLEGFASGVAPRSNARLALAGPSTEAVRDDPEGRDVLREVIARREALPADVRDRVHLVSLPMDDAAENAAMVNALQRRSDVVVQKSLAEGFGLTVAEAMWKARPVVASRVGGIQDQIQEGVTGELVDASDPDDFARVLVHVLNDTEHARSLGVAARAQVRDAFLGPRHLIQYVDLMKRLIRSR